MSGTAASLGFLSILMAVALLSSAPGIAAEDQGVEKWGESVDPDALRILKGMTDYLGSQQDFAMHTENTYEDVLETEQKIQFSFASSIVVHRPNKLRAERSDGTSSRLFVFDGETISMYDKGHNLFASVPAPDTIDDALFFARDELDLIPPSGDLIFSNAFDLLTSNITSGFVVGKAVIAGVSCDHLAFTTPVVDWQVWIADGGAPLPYKYVLTTRDDPAQPQFVTMISNWNTDPEINPGTFDFEPPPTAIQIDIARVDPGAN